MPKKPIYKSRVEPVFIRVSCLAYKIASETPPAQAAQDRNP
jgi:hypothetical protein